MDELLDSIQDFLNQEAVASTDSDVEIHYELDCQLCDEDGFSECQGHPYSSSNDVFLE
jgi:hypothetical protein